MLNTLYTHGTNIPLNHTHMHNKILCKSKIAFNSSVRRYRVAVHNSSIELKKNQQKRGEAAMHVSVELQSSPTRLWHGHKVLSHKPCYFIKLDFFFFALCKSPHLWNCSCTMRQVEGEGKEVQSQAGKGRLLVPFSSSKGMPAVGGTAKGDWFEV